MSNLHSGLRVLPGWVETLGTGGLRGRKTVKLATVNVREELYLQGIRLCLRFLEKNKIGYPVFMTYTEAHRLETLAAKVLHRVQNGPKLGTGTGLYTHNHVFVNLPATALPVSSPTMWSWSYPCWKTDRTAVGVVAHEVGHHVEAALQRVGRLTLEDGKRWRELIQLNKKQVTGYEPVPSEAWAETMRLFILNPDLLQRGIPVRYGFIVELVKLKPVERRPWREVLKGANELYLSAGERWTR